MVNSRIEWKDKVLSAVKDALNSPHGGRVEIIIHAQRAGEREIVINPFILTGTKTRVTVLSVDD